jgi:acyl-coenzyme A thioesterase PaaI-like protein
MAAHLLRKLSSRVPAWLVRVLANFWPPYLGAGIKVLDATSDYRYIKVTLKRRWYNMNYVGTQFGGSIYSMTDPFFMLMIINNLGSGYIVWDKAASIEFKRPGKTALYAEFRIGEALLNVIRDRCAGGEKYIFDLPVEVVDESGQVIAQVMKTIYVRKKSETGKHLNESPR